MHSLVNLPLTLGLADAVFAVAAVCVSSKKAAGDACPGGTVGQIVVDSE